MSQQTQQTTPTVRPSKSEPQGAVGKPAGGAVQLKQSLVGKSYDEQVAALAPVQMKGEGADPAKLRSEITEAAKVGGDDDYVRDTIGPQHLAIASAAEKAAMIVNLLDGDTGDQDEAKILDILRGPGGYDVFLKITAMGHLQWLFDDVNGEEGDQLGALYTKLKGEASLAAAQKKKEADRVAAEAKAKAEADKPVAREDAKPTTEVNAATPEVGAEKPITDPNDPRMSEYRKKMIHEGERRMESRPGGTKTVGGKEFYTGGAPKNNGHKDATNLFDGCQVQTSGTSCGLLPGVLLQRLGVNKNPKTTAITQYVTSSKTDGMEGLGTQFGAWVTSTGKNRPQPGDIYVMYNRDNSAFEHVGVVHTIGEETWETMDSGQGRGLMDSAVKATKYIMSAEDRAKAGLPPGIYHHPYGSTPDTSGPNARIVRGWVDIDKLMAYVNSAK